MTMSSICVFTLQIKGFIDNMCHMIHFVLLTFHFFIIDNAIPQTLNTVFVSIILIRIKVW